jgi:hypothetical protein
VESIADRNGGFTFMGLNYIPEQWKWKNALIIFLSSGSGKGREDNGS